MRHHTPPHRSSCCFAARTSGHPNRPAGLTSLAWAATIKPAPHAATPPRRPRYRRRGSRPPHTGARCSWRARLPRDPSWAGTASSAIVARPRPVTCSRVTGDQLAAAIGNRCISQRDSATAHLTTRSRCVINPAPAWYHRSARAATPSAAHCPAPAPPAQRRPARPNRGGRSIQRRGRLHHRRLYARRATNVLTYEFQPPRSPTGAVVAVTPSSTYRHTHQLCQSAKPTVGIE